MRKSYRYLAAGLMVFFFSVCAKAQITITGNVHNSSTKEAVPSVSVVVKGTSQGTYTDPDGTFTLKVRKLPVVLVFTSVGFDAQEITVSSSSQKIDVDFKVNTTMGQDVVVAATRTPQRILEAPVTIERMSNNILRNVPAPNYYEAIANLKGVDMHTASLTFRTPTTRGFVASGNLRLNQLIDGMDNQAPGLNFSVGNIVGLTSLDVDNIELLAGASSALYGSGGMNGTLLINSKNPFKYQGFSYEVKQGINHVDGKQHKAAPFYNWTARWAHAINDKFAMKFAFELVKAQDWQAEDYRDKSQIGTLSTVVGGNRDNDPNFNGVNMYGDETSANMLQFAQLIVAKTELGVPGMTNALSNYFNSIGNPVYPTNAQMAGAVALFPAPAQPAVQNALPFFVGAKINTTNPSLNGVNNYFGNYSVSRTGYEEKYLVDYGSLGFKFTGGLHYKLTPGTELSWNTYWGTGTTVYTGADRYSLRNFKIAQHKLELRSKNWFVRAYGTFENAGESYNATAAGAYINEAWKPSSTWFAQYIGTFSETRRQGGPALADITIHSSARALADAGRLLPGTKAFNDTLLRIRNTPIKYGGALFLDKSRLYSSEGQLNLSDAAGFSDKLEVLLGASWKQWVMNSQGTIFADTTFPIKVNEVGAYVQFRKKLFNDILSLTASGRYDKQTNFEGRFTPRFTAVVRVAKDNNIRLSYQTAYRFPSNQDQYISLVTGSGTLIGCLPQFQTFYKLNTTNPGYTPESILAYRASGNPASTNLLVQGSYSKVKPETVGSFEVGYKGIVHKDILIDAYFYYSRYKNFLARVGLGQSQTGSPTGVFSPFTTTNISFIQNSSGVVKALGWGIGIEDRIVKNFVVYGNVFSDELRDVPAGLITFFNAPKYRYNIGLRNDNVYKNVGFNVVAKWQDNVFYEGTFVTGTLPYFTWIDAQITYRPPHTKSLFRIGGTNVGNSYYRTGFGSPAVGGLYYISYGYNVF